MHTTYRIRFGRQDGSLACLVVIGHASDAAAVKLAHSLNTTSYEQVEVWRGEQCVHAAGLTHPAETETV